MTKEEISKLDICWRVLIAYEEIYRELAQFYGNGDHEVEDECFSEMCARTPSVVASWDVERASLRGCLAFQMRWHSIHARAKLLNRRNLLHGLKSETRVELNETDHSHYITQNKQGFLDARAALAILDERLTDPDDKNLMMLLRVYYCGKYTLGQLAESLDTSKSGVHNILLKALETCRLALGVNVNISMGELPNSEMYWPKSLTPAWAKIKQNGIRQDRKKRPAYAHHVATKSGSVQRSTPDASSKPDTAKPSDVLPEIR